MARQYQLSAGVFILETEAIQYQVSSQLFLLETADGEAPSFIAAWASQRSQIIGGGVR